MTGWVWFIGFPIGHFGNDGAFSKPYPVILELFYRGPIKNHGGAKKSVVKIHQWVRSKQFSFVCRTDIKGYYANINKYQLLEQLALFITCPIILNLLGQFLHYSVEYGGNFHTPKKGIARGYALSPLFADFQLYCIDQFFSQQKQIRYQRCMDDFFILCKTRWHLRRAVKQLNQFFNHFGFVQHPDNTIIGKLTRTTDWLGYLFNEHGLCGAAPRTLENVKRKLCRLLPSRDGGYFKNAGAVF